MRDEFVIVSILLSGVAIWSLVYLWLIYKEVGKNWNLLWPIISALICSILTILFILGYI